MIKTMMVAVALTVGLTGAAAAGEIYRSGTVIGPYGGQTTYDETRSCYNGSCSLTGQATGPNGGIWTRSGSATRVAPGEWQYQRTTTGPYGGNVNRSGTIRATR